MPVSISLDIVKDSPLLAAARKGTLTDDVYVQFICNTGPGGQHDPDAPPDSHVRPSHAAFHGRIFKLSEAPVPPLDYGCRCAIHFVAAPGSAAEDLLEDVADEKPTTPAVATAQWLDANVDEWRKVAKSVKSVGPKDALQEAYNAAKDFDIPQARSIADMIIDVLRSKIL